MKTLIEDEFENDPAAFIRWAFGSEAEQRYQSAVQHEQRPGQALMNVLYEYDRQGFDVLAGSALDPFYNDDRIPAALDRITSK